MKFFITDKIKNYKWLLDIGAVFFICFLVLSAVYFSFEFYYQNKIYPGIKIADIDLGGKNRIEAAQILNSQIDNINQQGIIFTYQDKKTAVMPIIASLNNEVAQQLIFFDPSLDIDAAYTIGREKNFFVNLTDKLSLLIFQINLPINTNFYKSEIEQILRADFSKYEQPAQDAQLKIRSIESENISVSLENERLGKVIDYEKALTELELKISYLKNTPINLNTITDYPEIYKKDCLNIDLQVKNALAYTPLILKSEEKIWEINKNILSDWLILKKSDNEIGLGLDKEKVNRYISLEIAPQIEVEPIDAKFEIKDGKVTEFLASQKGIKIDKENTILKIENEFLNRRKNELELIVNHDESGLEMENINELGIKEIVGTGHSNFAGSPANRIHNITVGAGKINGVLIKPGEEFSLVNVLGAVTAESGYKPELVIKGNRTIPEYGGGLCQVATTLFRAAIQSGLPITARRNHSYQVSYYEPTGTDAAIYIPQPDVKFINDSAHHLLIQVRIEKNDIYFDFWGSKDSRVVEIGEPVVFNIVKPGPTKIIESVDLAPGQKKCTESAHNGADAYFDYKVTYPNGDIKEERFKSHYVPWQAVCLVGAEKKEEVSENSDTPNLNELVNFENQERAPASDNTPVETPADL